MRPYLKSWPDLIVPSHLLVAVAPSSTLFALLPINKFPNKLAPKVPNNIMRNPPFCSFASFLIVRLTPFVNEPDYSILFFIRFFIISLFSSFMIINAVLLEAKSEGRPVPNTFLWIAAFVAYAVFVAYTAAVNPNGIKIVLANGSSVFLTKVDPVFSNGPKGLLKNPPECPILCNWVFDNFILAD